MHHISNSLLLSSECILQKEDQAETKQLYLDLIYGTSEGDNNSTNTNSSS
ncbi:6472_t:CDS:2 [Scutellospora calospora]|uniref:6472_t:CDS:1 n=1 Tax=Scutellospora calospora TaxID=85575 RepID=A0ACA9K5C6_9GLOM|nr:6472_t:CDS:2 [Scutellospora calospora]